MKKYYEDMKMDIIICEAADIVRTSVTDNVVDLPDFPEGWIG